MMKNIEQYTQTLKVTTIDFWELLRSNFSKSNEMIAWKLCTSKGIRFIEENRSHVIARDKIIYYRSIDNPRTVYKFFYDFCYIILSNEYHISTSITKHNLSISFADDVSKYLFKEDIDYFDYLTNEVSEDHIKTFVKTTYANDYEQRTRNR